MTLRVVRGINFPSGLRGPLDERLEQRLEPGAEVTDEHRRAMGPRALQDYLACGAVVEDAPVEVHTEPQKPAEGEKE